LEGVMKVLTEEGQEENPLTRQRSGGCGIVLIVLIGLAFWGFSSIDKGGSSSGGSSGGRVSVGNSEYESVDWERKLCGKTLGTYALLEYPVPSYIRITCKDVAERGVTGAKWKNEAGECAGYDGITLIRCMDDIFK
jgi:hypothetical protein